VAQVSGVETGYENASIVAEVVRGAMVESVHHGSVAGLGSDGGPALAVGAPERPVFGRSCLKPVQALAMLRAGLDLDGALLAVVAGSHTGGDVQVAAVREVLRHAGLSEQDLKCPPDLPADPDDAAAQRRSGAGPRPVFMNCSGKHAGMLATCVAAGWPTGSYLDPEHPLQQAVRATLVELAGEPVAAVAVDGCGAPLFGVSLTGLARAVRAVVVAPSGSPARRIADAMRAHPEIVGGAGKTDTRLMRAVPGLVAKDGAEGVAVAVAADGRACAVKIADGAHRAAGPVLLAALGALGVVPAAARGAVPSPAGGTVGRADLAALADLAAPPVLGGGRRVGEVRARPIPVAPT
jgi:L-asparaginase II